MADIKDELQELIDKGLKFPVVYADPAWTFKTYSAKGESKAPQKHYSTMSIEDIKNLPVKEVAADNSILYLWVYQPLLPEAFEVMQSWGYRYVTIGHVWNKLTKTGKPAFGTGYYTRTGMEMCLIGRRGNPPRPKVRNVRQCFSATLGAHSEKPEIMYDFIEAMYDGDYLELFARNQPRPDWTKLGNEKGKLT